jgi:hypothetical protein
LPSVSRQNSAAAAQAAVEARARRLLREAASDARRLALAERAIQAGEVSVAGRLLANVSLSRADVKSAGKARQQLAEIQKQGRSDLKAIDDALAGGILLPIDDAAEDAFPSVGIEPRDSPDAAVLSAFAAYDRLARKYAGVPQVGDEIRRHVSKQRRQPEYAAVLNEREARELWDVAQHHESTKELCCAYLAYEAASRLAPAPSAERALARFVELTNDKTVVASAKSCRELKWCHAAFRRAELLNKVKPDAARSLFAQIIQRAPDDSSVHVAALAYLK